MITIIRKREQETTEWSGGTTTQLYIYPENASYLNRDFQFRISTATVDVEESNFTKLPNVSRHIMVLNGLMKLSHKDHHTITLNKFETDSFYGDWNTKSKGKVTDFNLMTTSGCNGSIDSSIINKGESLDIKAINEKSFVALYIVEGEIIINIDIDSYTIKKGDIIVYSGEEIKTMTSNNINAQKHSEIAIAVITRQ